MTAAEHALAMRYGFNRPIVEPRTVPAPALFPKKPAYVVREVGGHRLLDTPGWGFLRKLPDKKMDKVTGRPVMLHKVITNARNYTSPFWPPRWQTWNDAALCRSLL